MRSHQPLSAPVHVHIMGGHYHLTEPLTLTPQDSGTPTAPIVYRGEPGALPVFSGGRVIRNWTQQPDGIWTSHLPEVADGKHTPE